MARPCGRTVYLRWKLRGATQDTGSFLKAKRAVEALPPGVAGHIMAQPCGHGVHPNCELAVALNAPSAQERRSAMALAADALLLAAVRTGASSSSPELLSAGMGDWDGRNHTNG